MAIDTGGPEPLRSLGFGELARSLARRIGALARKEAELVRAELREDIRHGRIAGQLGGAAAVAFIGGFACAVLAILDLLAHAMPRWLAAAFTCMALLLIGAVLARYAARAARRARPQRSIETARATVDLLNGRASS